MKIRRSIFFDTPDSSSDSEKTDVTPTREPAKTDGSALGIDFKRLASLIEAKSNRTPTEMPVPEQNEEPECPGNPATSEDTSSAEQEPDTSAVIRVCAPESFAFLAGTQSFLQLKITPVAEDLKSVSVWVVPMLAGETGLKATEIPFDEVPQAGKTNTIEFPFCPDPSFSGQLKFRFYFVCMQPTKVQYYTMKSGMYLVYPKKSQPESVVNRISIQASEAGTVHAGFQDILSEEKETAAVKNMIRKLAQTDTVFRAYPLMPTYWRPENVFIQGRQFAAEHLSLEINSHIFRLFSAGEVTFGRTFGSNDIVVADHLSTEQISGSEKIYPNNTVSGSHASIHFENGAFHLKDTSRYGTLLNHEKICGTACEITEDATVEIGDFVWKIALQTCNGKQNALFCANCPGGPMKALAVLRNDAVRESYLLVPQCCSLGSLQPNLTGYEIIRIADSFVLKTADGPMYYLAPGFELNCGNLHFQIH